MSQFGNDRKNQYLIDFINNIGYNRSMLKRPLTQIGIPKSVLSFIFNMLCIKLATANLIDKNHPALAQHPQTIENGVFLKITPSGEDYFKKHLDLILQSMSFYPDQGFFPRIVNNLDIASTPEDQKRISAVKDILAKVLPGIQISPPTPILYFEDLGYTANLKHLSMSLDRDETKRQGIQNGAVFKIELEADQIHVETGAIGITDPSNNWAGNVALEDVELNTDPSSQRLKAWAQLKVSINPDNYHTQFEVQKIESNISLLALNYEILRISTPDVSVHIGKRKFTLNKKAIHETLNGNEKVLIENLKNWLHDLVSKTLPSTLTKIMATYLEGEFGQTIYFRPPGAPEKKAVPDFIMSLVASELNRDPDGVNITLASRIWDPTRPNTPLTKSQRIAKGKALFNHLKSHQYDLGISLNKGLVNHLTQLSFDRGYFKRVELTNGDTASLTAAPQFETVPLKDSEAKNSVDPKRIRVWIKTKYKTKEFHQILVHPWVDVAFEITGYLMPSSAGNGMQFVCDKINERTFWFPKTNYKGIASFFHPFVESELKGFLVKLNKDWSKKPLIFPQVLPLPPSFFGMPMILIDYQMESNGFLTLFTRLPKGASL